MNFKQDNYTRRDKLIDIAKGVGILLVVFAHTYSGILSGAIYYFHMPLFFMLTGCALTYSSYKGMRWGHITRASPCPTWRTRSCALPIGHCWRAGSGPYRKGACSHGCWVR